MGEPAKWLHIGEEIYTPELWEYFCETCRAMQLLAGDDREMYHIGDL